MIAPEVLSDLRQRGVELIVTNGELRYRAPRGVLTPELRATLSKNRAELLAMLTTPLDERRLDTPDCMTLIREAFTAVEAAYTDGALGLLDTDADLCRRFRETEAAVDAAARRGPTEAEMRAALRAHVAVIREACQRRRAQREAANERPPRMPDLPDDAVAAIGFRYASGGAWSVVLREPEPEDG